jgi:drug/metabolite transporter (DMT)-like permease
LVLTIGSALLLGIYDYLKKSALRDNAVVPVLFGSVAAGALVWLPFVIWSAMAPQTLPHAGFDVCGLSLKGHWLLALKALIVGSSWFFGYLGMKSLPLSIASPVRATGPLWTIAFAVLCFGESPTLRQWCGVAVILLAFFAFSAVGRREGIHFHRDRGIIFMIVATLLGAGSSLYDKHLLQTAHLAPGQVQAWFTIYTSLLLLPLMVWWWHTQDRSTFQWRWAVPGIGLALLAADLLYFTAIAQPGAMISLISPVRRASVVVSFVLGIVVFGERQFRIKALCVVAIVGGLLLLA